MIRRALLAGAALLLAGNAPVVTAATGAPVTIEINQFQFGPNDITVEPGTIVEWVNHDQTVHNIIVPGAKVSSPGMDTGDHFTFKFDAAGDYSYLCGLHPHMTGVVHVKTRG